MGRSFQQSEWMQYCVGFALFGHHRQCHEPMVKQALFIRLHVKGALSRSFMGKQSRLFI